MNFGPGGATAGMIQHWENARQPGSTLVWPPGIYNLNGSVSTASPGKWDMQGVTINSNAGQLVVRHSDFTIAGGKSKFNFASGDPALSLDRAIRLGGGGLSSEYITSPIAAGATSFVAADADAATLNQGDWVCVVSVDPTNWVRVEYKQVAVIDGAAVHVTSPFVQDFPPIRAVHWVKLINPIHNVRIKDLMISTTNLVNGNVGIDAQPGVIDLTVEDCRFDIANGLACNLYGLINPKALNNVIRQTGRRFAVSSCQGGEISGNVFRNGALTVETGTFCTLIERNELAGPGGAAMIYHNDSNYCRYRNNLIMGDGAAIGILVQGGSDNSFSGDTIVNVSEGITIVSDTSLSAVEEANRNFICGEVVRRAGTGIKVADANCHDNTISSLDATVKVPIYDLGVNTLLDGVKPPTPPP